MKDRRRGAPVLFCDQGYDRQLAMLPHWLRFAFAPAMPNVAS